MALLPIIAMIIAALVLIAVAWALVAVWLAAMLVRRLEREAHQLADERPYGDWPAVPSVHAPVHSDGDTN